MNRLRQLGWPELEFNGRNVMIHGSDSPLINVSDNNVATLHFIQRKVDEDETISFGNRYNYLESLIFPTNFQVVRVLTRDLKLRQYQQLNDVFKFNSNHVNCITVTTEVDEYEVASREHTVKINPNSLIQIVDHYDSIYEDAKNYSNKFVLYKATEFQKHYFGIEKERKTTTNKGEFTFIIDRFNLPTKKAKSDFEKYLSEGDIISLQEFTLNLIQKEVFGSDFLTKLNDYFIKVRLEDILKLGREILNLKSSNLKTNNAQKVIHQVEPDGRKVKQLESVWQKYFEKYLSYLIFSYQRIYPKVELNVDLKKKYPDFVGINHFGGVDIIEIKTHLKNAVTRDSSHDNYAFSSEMSKAIIQTINYMDALIQERIKKKVQRDDLKGKILEGNIYRPRGIIIISSYDYLAKGIKPTDPGFKQVQRDFTKLRHGLHNIQILTFDELLDMAENYKENIVK